MTKKDQIELFDSFMEFLRSDLWQIPVYQFIELHSIIFEREHNLSSSPSTVKSFNEVHNEFTKIVTDLVNAYCDDSNQIREEVMEALKTVYQEKFQQMTNKDKMIIEPIVASEHFDVFVPMMMRKNIELQLQALKMIEQHMKGLLPNSLKLGEEDAKLWEALDAEEKDESERLILLAVLRESKEEWENDQRMRADSEGQMERALRESLEEKVHLEEMRQNEQLIIEKAITEKLTNISIDSTNNVEKSKTLNYPSSSIALQNNIIPSIKEINNEEKIQNNNNKQSGASEANKKIKNIEKGILSTKEKLESVNCSNPGSSRKILDLESGKLSQLNPSDAEKTRLVRSFSNAQGEENNNKINNEKNNKKSSENVDKKRRSLGQVNPPSRGKNSTIAVDQNNNNDLAYRSLLKKRDNISDENIQSRMHYLREQRDKLLQKKSMERQKQLLASTDVSRPRTAIAARGLMAQKDSSELEERRRIAAKIKAEVIDKHQLQTTEKT